MTDKENVLLDDLILLRSNRMKVFDRGNFLLSKIIDYKREYQLINSELIKLDKEIEEISKQLENLNK